jgi:hypothetical protein
MVKITKPALKETEAFYKNLYLLHDICSTQYDYEKIKVLTSSLKERIADLNKAQLPVRLKKKQDEFNKVRTELINAVESLDKVVKEGNNQPIIGSAIDMVYLKYHALEKLVD